MSEHLDDLGTRAGAELNRLVATAGSTGPSGSAIRHRAARRQRTIRSLAVICLVMATGAVAFAVDDGKAADPTVVASQPAGGPADTDVLDDGLKETTTTTPVDVSTTTVATTKPVASTVTGPTTSTTAKASRSTAPPVFQEASIDRDVPSITVTFDVPVRLNPEDSMPGMRILNFGQSSTCDWRTGPQGNGHELLSGEGTRKLTFDLSGLKPGTVHVSIVEGLVVSVDGGVANERVPCVAIPGGDPVGPTAGFMQADVTHQQVDINFDSDVDLGDPGQLLVYGADRTCTTLAGRGTKVEYESQNHMYITVTASGIVPGYTYIRIEPGLVTGTEGALPNTATACRPVQVFDAPNLVKTTPDLSRSTIAFTFDRPVRLSSWVAVYTATDPSYQDWAKPTRSVETGDTTTIVLEVANLRPGTLYVKVWHNFVAGTEGDVLNTEMPWYPIEVGPAP